MIRTVGAFVAALLAGMLFAMILLPFGLILHEIVIWPLALAVAAAFAGLAASIVGRAPPLRSVAAAEVAAAVCTVVAWSPVGDMLGRALPNGAMIALAYVAVIAVGATIPSLGPRDAQEPARRRWGMVAVAVAALLTVPATLFVAWLLGLAGA